MPKFVHKKVDAVAGKLKFQQLVILGDDQDADKIQKEIENKENSNQESGHKGILDKYEEDLEEKDKSSYLRILANMNRVANRQSLPKEKFRDITPKGDDVKEYEFKHGDLRIYSIKVPNGQMVILGGYKNNQKGDINRFRSLKAQYLRT